jgi:hypothetical protein
VGQAKPISSASRPRHQSLYLQLGAVRFHPTTITTHGFPSSHVLPTSSPWTTTDLRSKRWALGPRRCTLQSRGLYIPNGRKLR